MIKPTDCLQGLAIILGLAATFFMIDKYPIFLMVLVLSLGWGLATALCMAIRCNWFEASTSTEAD